MEILNTMNVFGGQELCGTKYRNMALIVWLGLYQLHVVAWSYEQFTLAHLKQKQVKLITSAIGHTMHDIIFRFLYFKL